MHPAEFEPTIPASERPQTHALDRAATGISDTITYLVLFSFTLSPIHTPDLPFQLQIHLFQCVHIPSNNH
jgi:hypothetical protein